MTSWMKCGAAVVMVVVFYVGVGNQATQVERASPTVVPITTTTPAVTTVSPNTIPIVSMSTPPQPASTVVEPWVTETTTTTTTIIFLTSYEPQTGRVLIFPSWLKHSVFPFYVDGERRSMSFNARYLDHKQQKLLKRNQK